MERSSSARAPIYALLFSAAFVVSSLILIQQSQALTASYGRPYNGYLENGIVFPTQFPGYHLRDTSRAYTTPEVAGAVLDAIEAVRAQFPDTCDVFIGDFSSSHGGPALHHRSHQNGRDVDIGMYAKGNRPLQSFIPMNAENLDCAKTWCLIENLARSQRVQYIFLDHRVQKVLYDYVSARGYDQAYLNRFFGNVRGTLIQHARNHVDHMHVRFFTPWSTLAAHIGASEMEKRMVIEMAQQSYLPKKVNYYVNGTEKGLDALAKSFGVSVSDLCRWNNLSPYSVLVPGSCLAFYKRSFESEPVHLARSLQPGFIAETPKIRMASLRSTGLVLTRDDASGGSAEREEVESGTDRSAHAETRTVRTASKSARAVPVVYKVKKGDTLYQIALAAKVDIDVLCRLNGIRRTTVLRPGQQLKTGRMLAEASSGRVATGVRGKSGSSAICFASDPRNPGSPTAAYYTVGRGDTLQRIAKKSGISIDSLCQLNGLKRNSQLRPGMRIKLTQVNLPVKPALGKASCPVGKSKAVKAGKVRPAKKASSAKAAVKHAPAGKAAKAATGHVKESRKSGVKKVIEAKKSVKPAHKSAQFARK